VDDAVEIAFVCFFVLVVAASLVEMVVYHVAPARLAVLAFIPMGRTRVVELQGSEPPSQRLAAFSPRLAERVEVLSARQLVDKTSPLYGWIAEAGVVWLRPGRRWWSSHWSLGVIRLTVDGSTLRLAPRMYWVGSPVLLWMAVVPVGAAVWASASISEFAFVAGVFLGFLGLLLGLTWLAYWWVLRGSVRNLTAEVTKLAEAC
jgi:hypothetical protein